MKSSTRRVRGLPVWLCIFLCVMADVPGFTQAEAQTAASREYKVKAAFLYNFAHFVEWPAEAFPDSGTPLVIGVLGEDPHGGFLDELVRDERVNGHPLIVQRFRRVEEIKDCHILFISPDSRRLDRILAGLKGRSILTIGETSAFAESGGIIQFTTSNGKIRLRINVEAAHAARLTISSKLLRSAEVVSPGKD